ncbi:MAG: hypothetical protein QNL04_01640 [SAR324 cluster bacterium]|nr:hypothetical protein [SAR324 cluster bacterium]
MKVFLFSVLCSALLFSQDIFAASAEEKAAKADCIQSAQDYGIEEADKEDYIVNCVEEALIDISNTNAETVEMEPEQGEEMPADKEQ